MSVPHVLPWHGHTDSPLGKSWERAGQIKPLSMILFSFAFIEGHAVARLPFYHHCFYRKKSSEGSYMGSPSWNWSSSLAQWSWAPPAAPLSVHRSVAPLVSCFLPSLLQGCCRGVSAWQPSGTLQTRTAGSRRPGGRGSRGAAGCSPSTWTWWARAWSRQKPGGFCPACGRWCSGCWRGRSSCR